MKELGNDNLEQIKQKGQKAWNQVLGKIEVEGGNLDQYRTFYSCLYRSLLFPENSTNWTKPENLFITALITGKFYRDICLPTPDFGIPSGVFSHY